MSGCGGGDDAAAVDPAATAAPVADPAGGVVADPGAAGAPTTDVATDPEAGSAPGTNEIADADAAAGSLVKLSAITPKKFAKAHCTKPIIVVFYQPGAVVDERLLGEASAAAAAVKGEVSLTFTPKDIKAYGDLPAKLGLLSTPGLAIVSRNGEIENFWTTFVDRALIKRSLQNAAAAKPCKLSSDEAVPAAGSAFSDAATVANGGTVTNTTTDPLAGTQPGTAAVDAAGAAGAGAGSPAVDTAANGAVAPTS